MSKISHEKFIENFKSIGQDKYFEVLSTYKSSREKMIFKCKKCNKVFSCTANNITKKGKLYGCPYCALEKRKNSEYLKI